MDLERTASLEQQRLQALHQLNLLDSPAEPEFDELVQLAATVCGVPVSIFSLVDKDRLWFKAVNGVSFNTTPRSGTFCHYAIREPGLMLVEDASEDPRFADSPLVAAEGGIRFYAGVPVISPNAQPIGVLCVMDNIRRTINDEQRAALRILARQVNARLELRLKCRELGDALHQAEAAATSLAAGEQRFKAFMDSGPFMAYLKDEDGRILYYNQKVAQHFEVSRDFLLNKTGAELWPAELVSSYREHDLQALGGDKLVVADEKTLNPDGSLSTWRAYKFACSNANGRPLLGGISLDVTAELKRDLALQRSQVELQDANRQLRELASVDPLTGLANRRVLDDRLRSAFRKARRSGNPISLLILDVDHFKTHNDRFGHAHGDTVLQSLALCLRASLRADDLLTRFGGEEFVVLAENTGEADASRLAHRLLSAVRGHTWPLAPVTVSIGLSTLDLATPDADHLLTLADEALYAAKRGGRDRAIPYADVFAETLGNTRPRRLTRLRKAIHASLKAHGGSARATPSEPPAKRHLPVSPGPLM